MAKPIGLNPMPKTNKKRIRINLSLYEDEHEEFIQNAAKLEGPPRGVKTRGLETAIRIFNNYFKEFNGNTQLIELAKQNNVPPWQMGATLIRIALPVYPEFQKYCDEQGVDIASEHLKLSKRFFKKH